MARYRLKRMTRNFGFIDGTVHAAGSTVETVGNVAKSGFGQTAGGVAGAMTMGSALGGMLGGGPLGMLAGYAGSYLAGKAATGAVGSGLQSMGQSMQNY